jgi:hypothetical protein
VATVFVTDTIKPAEPAWPGLEVISVAPLLAQAIRKNIGDGSDIELA